MEDLITFHNVKAVQRPAAPAFFIYGCSTDALKINLLTMLFLLEVEQDSEPNLYDEGKG